MVVLKGQGKLLKSLQKQTKHAEQPLQDAQYNDRED